MYLLKDNEISIEEWDTLISGSYYSSAFQTYAYYDLFNSVSGLSANVFAIKENSDLKALCVVTLQKEPGIKGFFSRRAIIYGGPVLKENCDYNLDCLLNSISKEFKNKSIYIEVRNLNNYNINKESIKKNGWLYIPYLNYIIDCSDKERLFQKLGDNRKRQIKKALNTGVEIKEVQKINEVEEYYKILQKLYASKIRKPLLPQEFFIEFFNRNVGKIFIVVYNNMIIGGIVCPVLKDKTIYELYVCGLDEEYKDQHPSIMATWAALNYANENRIPIFDFMGAGKPDAKYGVRDFKARFGGNEIEYGRFMKVNRPILYSIGKSFIKVRQRIP